MAQGRYNRFSLGPSATIMMNGGNGTNSFSMSTVNNGVCYRFMAQDARDITAVHLFFSSVTAPGTMTLRIETIDTSTGKPTGTLYDANASKSFTPTDTNCIVTFTTPPTTGLTPGNLYGIVILTTVAGTTQSICVGGNSQGAYPYCTLTATDGTTRTNFAESSNQWPVVGLVYEDGVEEQWMFCPSFPANDTIYGTRAFGAKFLITTPVAVRGISTAQVTKTGTPPGHLRWRIRDMGNSILYEQVFDKIGLTNVNTKKLFLPYCAYTPAILRPGWYRIVLDQTDHASTSGHNWGLPRCTWESSAMPSGFFYTGTSNVDGTPISWDLEDPLSMPCFSLLLDDVPDPRKFRHRKGVA